MRILVFGAGGVGGYLGAKLWHAGHDVTFVARGEHLSAMKQHGLLLRTPELNIHVTASFTDSLIDHPTVDFIIVAVKSFDTRASADLFKPVLRETTAVLSIQNGVENESVLAEVLGSSHILAGVANIFSTIAAPGIIQQYGSTAKFKFGESDGRMSARCRDLEAMFRTAGTDFEQVEDVQKYLWEKWVFICGLGGMTAFTRIPIGDILADPQMCEMLEQVVRETTAVSRAMRVSDFAGLEERTLSRYRRLPATHTSSMYFDVMHGKRVEIEALNGAAVRFGRTNNLQTPANLRIYKKLSQFA